MAFILQETPLPKMYEIRLIVIKDKSLKFISMGSVNTIQAYSDNGLAWCQPGEKPLYEPMIISLLTHICVTRPQWIKSETSW